MSVQQTSGDLTSPSTYLNNTATGLFSSSQHLQTGLAQQGDPYLHQHSSMLPHPQHQQAGDSSMLAHPGAAGADYDQGNMGLAGLGSLDEHDPLQHAGPDSHPLMLATADSLLSHGSTDLCGLEDGFDVDGMQQQQQQHHHGGSFGTAAGATRISIDMQDVLHTGMPGGHTGSPQLQAGSHSPGLSHFGGNGQHAGHDSYTADSLKSQQQNGTHYGALVPQEHLHHQQQHQQQQQATQQQQQRQPQRQSQAQQRQAGAGSSRAGSSAAAAAAAAGGGGDAPAQPVLRSQYRGVSYDKKKRKWRVQIKVAALGKSGELSAGS